LLYTRIARPLLFRLDPEFTHCWAIRLGHLISRSPLASQILRRLYSVQFSELEVEVFGLTFSNPVGLAAGFDKHGLIFQTTAALGFGHMEIGSVSLRPWPGNPSPTLLRLPRDGGLINRPGLNSDGSDVVYRRLRHGRFEIPTGVNLAKTADPNISGQEAIEDYLQCFQRFHPIADFITLNLSCPNSPDGCTFQDPSLLRILLQRVRDSLAGFESGKAKPLIVKISPDLDDRTLESILELSKEYAVDGYVIANTTECRQMLTTPRELLQAFGYGGVSGRPLKPLVKRMVEHVYHRTGGKFPIIACGGIGCDSKVHPAEEVWEYLQAGASMVQLYTGLIYRGPAISGLINRRLVEILRRNRIASLSEFLRRRDGI
jgi:dihydroorotate dehydrogenase